MNDKHLMEHQWVAMNAPNSDNPTEIKAYLKVSIQVCGPNDSAVQLKEDGALANESNVMMPSSISKVYKQVAISIIRIEGLPDTDKANILDQTVLNAFVST
jgi:hypothetical protein